MKPSNIVHQYFKKEMAGMKILLKVNPLQYSGTELTVDQDGEVFLLDLWFDEHFSDNLTADGYVEVNAIEYNLYLSGLIR